MENHKVALVTGGMESLGTAICRRLHADGFQVATTYSPQFKTPEGWLAAQRDDGFDFRAFKVDVGDYADCEWMVQKLLAETGRLDVLVNNAGSVLERSLHSMRADDWKGVMHANLDSVFNVSKQVLEPMTVQRWGRIINISSVSAQQGAPRQAAHAAAKAGMQGFTRSLALELARHGITVNTVSPGHLRTRSVQQMTDEDVCAEIVPHIPVGRLGLPEEVAALVAYLVSEESAFVTGANIAINGGQYMS